MKKKKQTGAKPYQHHVWQHYLQAWAGADGAVFCLQDNRIYPTGTNALGVERDFYKVPSLSSADLTWLSLFVFNDRQHPQQKKLHADMLSRILGPIAFVKDNRHQLNNLHLIDKLIDVHCTNVVDDYHTMFERGFLELLPRVLAGDIEWYKDPKSSIAFFLFIAAQHMRTKAVRENTISGLSKTTGIDISRIWGILVIAFIHNIGFGLHLERASRPLVLLRNDSNVRFITSDQPTVNMHGDGKSAPDKLSFYYPVSPQLALYLADPADPVDAVPRVNTDADVLRLNLLVANQSFRQIYACALEDLEAIRDAKNGAVT